MDEINIGDRVMYIDAVSKQDGKRYLTVKVPKFGNWDGEKVILEDDEKTTVRNKKWLTIVSDEKG